MSKHPWTPGPWRAYEGSCEIIGNSTLIATVHWHSGLEVEDDANIRLIAAAPELYEALALVIDSSEWTTMEVVIQDEVLAALAKARGES